ncbi:hypothetical protein C8J57DRAFT_1251101 [Mycena rebaudengoi]|nr:hypothetical protein C8J57DRAFT_1251101 [Mycena rebaudengoi]
MFLKLSFVIISVLTMANSATAATPPINPQAFPQCCNAVLPLSANAVAAVSNLLQIELNVIPNSPWHHFEVRTPRHRMGRPTTQLIGGAYNPILLIDYGAVGVVDRSHLGEKHQYKVDGYGTDRVRKKGATRCGRSKPAVLLSYGVHCALKLPLSEPLR